MTQLSNLEPGNADMFTFVEPPAAAEKCLFYISSVVEHICRVYKVWVMCEQNNQAIMHRAPTWPAAALFGGLVASDHIQFGIDI